MNPSTAYLTHQIATASPAKRVAMLHDRAISALHEAIEAIEAGDIQRRWSANNRAVEILDALWVTLDTEKGGEIAANLERLYSFMLNQLVYVDIRNDPVPAREVIGLLEPLRKSWNELARREDLAVPIEASAPGSAMPAPTCDPVARRIVVSA